MDTNIFPIEQHLKEFLKQAKTKDQKTSRYPRSFNGFTFKVSFGIGNKANIPWIAVLENDKKVSEGIYPVYLYYINKGKLLLCFGVSEKKQPKINWSKNISDNYKQVYQVIDKPKRYKKSYVYKEYNIKNNEVVPDGSNIKDDFLTIVDIYKNELKNSSKNGEDLEKQINGKLLKDFIRDVKESGLQYSDQLIVRFMASLCTKPFVILTGLSGSGKTKLAQAFANWICNDENQICMVPVGADWTNRENLVGYPNALERGQYVKPDNGVLQLIINANKEENSNKPFFIILDEMNLSHVERYFSDFLSAMESAESIPLHADDDEWKDDVPAKIKLSPNIFVIGTVNIDETTYMFSPKVLDRANVIEFRVSDDEIKSFLEKPSRPEIAKLKRKGSNMETEFIEKARKETLDSQEISEIKSVLFEFFNELKKVGAEFGYRVASEIFRLASQISLLSAENGGAWKLDEIADAAIIQKLLPKVHGSRSKLEPILKTLATLCLNNKEIIDDILLKPEKYDYSNQELVRFPLSLEKIIRMRKRVIQDGFTSFAEA